MARMARKERWAGKNRGSQRRNPRVGLPGVFDKSPAEAVEWIFSDKQLYAFNRIDGIGQKYSG